MATLIIPFYSFILAVIFNIFFGSLIVTYWNEITLTNPYIIVMHCFLFWIVSFHLYSQYYIILTAKPEFRELCFIVNLITSIPIAILLLYDWYELPESWNFFSPKNITDDEIWNTMNLYHSSTTVANSWNAIQIGYDCCGWNGAEDWRSVGMSLPQTCLDHNLHIKSNGCRCQIITKFMEAIRVSRNLMLYYEVLVSIMMVFNIVLLFWNVFKNLRVSNSHQQNRILHFIQFPFIDHQNCRTEIVPA